MYPILTTIKGDFLWLKQHNEWTAPSTNDEQNQNIENRYILALMDKIVNFKRRDQISYLFL